MIDEIFGDCSVFVLQDDDILTPSINDSLQDDLFGDLSNFILDTDLTPDEPSEITVQPDPIDPVATGIEVSIPLIDDSKKKININVQNLNAEEKIRFDNIKAYEKKLKNLNPMQIAELAIVQKVENPLLFSVSNDYLFRTPYDLSLAAFTHEYNTVRNLNYEFNKRMASPFIVDSEYQCYREEYKQHFKGRKKLNLTVQIRGIHQDADKKVYCHWDMVTEELPLHFPHLRKTDSCVFERYLKDGGYNIRFQLKDSGLGEVEYLDASRKNVLQIPVFGHMLQADFMAMWQPKTAMYRYFERIISGRDKHNDLDGKKRLIGESDVPELLKPRILAVEQETGEKIAIEFIFYDSQSLHGIGKSLADLAKVTNTDILDDKEIFTREMKEDMLAQYKACSNPVNRDNWVRYSVHSDLEIYTIFINNAKAFYNLYTDTEIKAGNYFTLPKLTIGRSVADIISARIISKFAGDIFTDLNILRDKIFKECTDETVLQDVKVVTEVNKTSIVKRVNIAFKPTNDYDRILLETICKLLHHSEKEFKENDDYVKRFVIQINLPDTLPKPIQQWIIKTFCGNSSAMNIAGLSDSRRINAKIQGGRCFRNRPLAIKEEGVIADPDYTAAYNSMMSVLELPMCANPFRIEHDLTNDNTLMSLAEFRKKYDKELIPGLYQLFASYTDETRNVIELDPKLLEYPQDLIPSYHPHASIKQLTIGSGWLEKTDTSYVYTNQITNAIFTHWNLQIIDFVNSKESKKELLESKIVSGIMYRKSDRVGSIRELLDGYRNHNGKNSYDICDSSEIITRNNYRGWFGFNLGELIATPIRRMRGKYPKKTPENEFYKLIGNTVYGVLCSKYFPVSNVVTANNITSGVRSGVWCLEKGLNSLNSITDGGLANLLKVAFSNGKKLNDKSVVQTHRLDKIQHGKDVRYGIIGGYKNIEWAENSHDTLVFTSEDNTQKVLVGEDASKHIDDLIFNHLAAQFPKLDIFHRPMTDDDGNPKNGFLRIECKGVVKSCVVRGASDYLVRGGFHAMYPKDKIAEFGDDGRVFAAMRSYRKGYGSHSQLFMDKLGEHPDMVERSEVFDQSILLKVGLYQERYRSYFENSDYQVGDTFFMERLIREFPLSAFTFKTASQREKWVREVTMMRGQYGQSIESLFVDDNGTVNYEQMINAFDMWIEAGYECLSDVYGDKKSVEMRLKLCKSHPEYESLKQRRLDKRKAKR